MENRDWEKIKDVFAQVLEQPKDCRANFLRRTCSGDSVLWKEINSLLKAHDETQHLIEKKDFGAATVLDANDTNYAGKLFGHYKIIREIGRGGMGAVFLAERSDGEFQQRVALKIVRRSFADTELERRFRRERQILATLNHPHIAQLHDGGISADGEPFLAMECVEGVRIDEFCDSQNLSTNERLKLFLSVCAAVSFAHQNLVVHRDLKPSNILVTKDGTVKLLDFGIAKLLDAEQSDEATQTGFRAFTPEYASPEQIAGEPITTASDVFSLGVILSELILSPSSSFENRLRNAKPTGAQASSLAMSAKARKKVSHSFKLNSIGTLFRAPRSLQAGTLALQSATAFSGYFSKNKKVPTELKNIVRMAQCEEPERRYASVAQFAEDVQRYLDGLPVRAEKDSFTYRAGNFVKRNRLPVAAFALVMLSLIGGFAVAAWQTGVAREKAGIAEENGRWAIRETEKTQKILGFMERVLSFANPAWYAEGSQTGGQARLIDVLDRMSEKIETEFAGDLDSQAELHHKCAEIFLANRMLDRAEIHARRALELRRRLLSEPPAVAGGLSLNSEPSANTSNAQLQPPATAGGSDIRAEVAKDLYYLGSVLANYGNYLETEKLFSEAAVIFRQNAPDNPNLPYLLEHLGDLKMRVFQDFDAAEKLFAESLELFRSKDGEIHLNTTRLYFQLSVATAHKGETTRAEELFREGETRAARLPDAANRLAVFHFRGDLELAKGNLTAAETAFKQEIDEIRKLKGANNSNEQNARLGLRETYNRGQNWAQAAETQAAIIETMKNQIPETSVAFGGNLAYLSVLLLRDGKSEQAKPYFEKAFQIFQNNPPNLKTSGGFQLEIGECLLRLNRLTEALPLLEEINEFYKANYPPKNPSRIRAEQLLAQAGLRQVKSKKFGVSFSLPTFNQLPYTRR